jgi:hypothetical protein
MLELRWLRMYINIHIYIYIYIYIYTHIVNMSARSTWGEKYSKSCTTKSATCNVHLHGHAASHMADHSAFLNDVNVLKSVVGLHMPV